MQGVVIAGTHSGCGKTIVTLGILAALRKRNYNMQAFKAGPDFIDTGLHELITGRSSRNLDLWMCGRDYVMECFKKQSADADIAVVEGVMGLYDGNPSTAVLSAALDLPVILVIDAYGMAESAGAVVKGFVDFKLQTSDCGNPESKISIAGIIFNRIASENHYKRLKNSVQGVPVLGYLPRNLAFEIPHRHLGLIIAEENPITKENIDKLADAVLEHIDVDVIIQKSKLRSQKSEVQNLQSKICNLKSAVRIAVACDRAFCFYYEDNLDLLRDAGGEVVTFSPLSDNKIPDNTDALYIGGGYPELYARELSNNKPMLKCINDWINKGKPVYAECGGFMYLTEGIYNFDDIFSPMVSIFPVRARMKKGRVNLGYREVTLKYDSILGNKGSDARGHEFHYSEIDNRTKNTESGAQAEDSFSHVNPRTLKSSNPCLIYSVKDNSGRHIHDEGYRFKNALGSYIHIHFGSNHSIARNFIRFCREASWR